MEESKNPTPAESSAPAAREAAPSQAPYRSGPRSNGPSQGGRRGGRYGGPRAPRTCPFCSQKAKAIDYKAADQLRRYLTDHGKIKARRKIGTCAKHQRMLSGAIKRARHVALLPYTTENIRAD